MIQEQIIDEKGIDYKEKGRSFPKAYVIQLRNEKALKESASGGFFTAISEWVIEQSGIVCGAAYDEYFKIVHVATDNIEGCASFRGSKYVQSEIGTIYSDIKTEFKKGRLCLFSGTPCQIAGLSSFLGKNYENLITVDLVCAGVPSPLLWKEYLEMQEQKYGAKVIFANFRHKTYGYQASTMRLKFDNGKTYSKSGRIDPMMKSFVRGMTKRPACYSCKFKGIYRPSDFTIFDGWHAGELTGKPDNGKGYTSILVNSARAENVFLSLTNYMMYEEVDLKLIVDKDGVMLENQPEKNIYRDDFYKLLKLEGFSMCAYQYCNINIKDLIIESLKPVLYKINLIKPLKKIKFLMKAHSR